MPGLDSIRSTCLTVCLALSPRATAKPWLIVRTASEALCKHAQRGIGERGAGFGVQARTQHLVQELMHLLTGERLARAPRIEEAASLKVRVMRGNLAPSKSNKRTRQGASGFDCKSIQRFPILFLRYTES